MTDDKEAVEDAERNRWHSEEIHGRNRFPMVSKEGQPALALLIVSISRSAGVLANHNTIVPFVLTPRLSI